MVANKDKELIEKYLSNKLNAKEKEEFEKNITTDKNFSEEVKHRRILKVVTERNKIDEFKAKLNIIHSNNLRREKKTRKVYMYSTFVVTTAALVLLFFFVENPLNSYIRINRYVAEVENIKTLSIQNLTTVNLKSDDNPEIVSYSDLKVGFIGEDEKHKNYTRYFFSKNILYLFKQSQDKVNLFYEIDADGRRIYYVCRNTKLYSFRQLKEGRFYDLQIINNSELEKLCE